jgi:hypothetical protein
MLQLQQTAGNQAVGQMLRGMGDNPPAQPLCASCKPGARCPKCQATDERALLATQPSIVQFKLIVNRPGDPYEQEADRVAERVMRMPSTAGADSRVVAGRSQGLRMQRLCKSCEDELPRREEEEQGMFQAKSAPGQSLRLSAVQEAEILSLRGSGQPLGLSARAFLEPRFGRDFGQVRVHTDAKANRLAQATNARAFTVGQDIVFGAGEYAPDTVAGRQLLAHELAHTIQQGGGQTAAPLSASQSAIPGQTEDHTPLPAYSDGTGGSAQRGIALSDSTGAAPALQRQQAGAAATAPSITEAEARRLLDAEDEQDQAEVSEEERQVLTGPDTEPPPGPIESEAATVQQEAQQQTDEIEIPEFDAQTGDACPQLIPEAVEEPEVGGEQQESSEGGFFSTLLSFVPSGALGLLGGAASWVWRQLPLSTRATAVNTGIDAAIEVLENLPGRTLVGNIWGWIKAGLIAFLQRLRRVPDEEKVSIFEKIGQLILGGDLSYVWGLAKGIVKGFFIDGLVGIVQMIVDLVCLVPKVGKFIEALGRFFASLPEDIEAAFNAIRDLGTALSAAIRGAAGEFLEMLRNPQRLVGLLDTVYTAGESMAREIGERIAEEFIKFFRQSAERIGERVGRIVGQLVFEVAFAFVTAGGGAALTGAKVAVRAAVRMIGQIGRRIFEVIRFIGRALDTVKDIVVRVRRYLTRLLRAVADKLYQAMEWVLDFFHSFGNYCRPGSVKCRVPRRRRRPRQRSPKCRGRFVPRLGGFRPHDVYATRVTGRRSDFRIVLGPVLRCTYDAKVGRELIECKTGYGWLQNPAVQSQRWFPFALARLDAQRYRCMLTAARCGYIYRWYMQNAGAASYLAARWRGIPPVLHRP